MREFILTNDEARRVDQYTMTTLGIAGVELMGKAGRFVSLKAKKILRHVPGSRVDLVCGTGNNGGDGFVAALDLNEWGADVYIWIIGERGKISGDALHFLTRCEQGRIPVTVLTEMDQMEPLSAIASADLIIDALLGTGLQGEVQGAARRAIEMISQTQVPVLAIDIPSGIRGDTGQVGGVAVQASKTVTMGFLKRGLMFQPGKRHAGEVAVVDLGYPPEAFEILKPQTFLIQESEISGLIPVIYEETYKHQQGKILVFAGSPGMTGAAALTCQAAMRTGAGLVVAAIPASLNPIMEIKLTEVLTAPVPESDEHTLCPAALEAAAARLEWSDVIVFGPGVSAHSAVQAFGRLLMRTDRPLVIDADGLRCLAGQCDLIREARDIILTPHHGEFALLTGRPVTEINRQPVEMARDFVARYPCTLVLKGAPTIVVDRDGTTVVNSTGNPGLATGGTGDVLTGMIAALRAQGMRSFEAAMAATFLHGLAGDRAREVFGVRGLIASDLLQLIPTVLKPYDRVV